LYVGDPKIPFWKEDRLTRALKQVALDSSAKKTHGGIGNDGLFYYIGTAPTVVYDMKEHKLETARDHIILTYNIERKGDVLLNMLVKSEHINIKEISLYQYDWTGSSKIVFYHSVDSKSEYVISPFIDGIPLQQIGKAIYLNITVMGGGLYVGGVGDHINVSATYAFLDDITRKNVASYQDGEGHGIRIRHIDGTIYMVHHVNDYGHSPNYLGPE